MLCRQQYRTCWKPTVVSQLQRGSEVHKPSIFSNISSSGLIRHDWSLNHLQEEPFHRMEFIFFRCLFLPTNNTHRWRKTLSFTSRRAAYMVLGKKGYISVQSPSLAHRFISGYSRWDAYWALKSLLFRNTNLGTSDFRLCCFLSGCRVISLLQYLLKSVTREYLICFCMEVFH